MPWEVDPQTNTRVWVDPVSGKAQLRDSQGRIREQDMSSVGANLLSGDFFVASPEEVEKEDAEFTPLSEQLATAGESTLAGALEIGPAAAKLAASAHPLTLAEKVFDIRGAGTIGTEALMGFSGRETVKGARVLAQEVFGDEMGPTGEAAGRKYDEEARARAKRNPWAQMGGQVLASVPMALATGGTGLAAKVGLGAAEGALGGAAMAGEEAWLADTEQTVESTLASTGLGGVLGGGATLGIAGVGAGLQGVGRYGRKLMGRSDDAAQNMAERMLGPDVPAGTGKLLQGALDDDVAAVIDQAAKAEATRSGTTLDRARDVIEDVWKKQYNLSDEQFQALKTAGPLRLTPEAKEWRAAERGADAAVERATRASTDSVNVLLDKSNAVTRHVVERPAKLKAVARNLSELSPAQQAAARDAALAELDNLSGAYGEALGASRAAAVGEDLAAKRAPLVAGKGAKTLRGNAVTISKLRQQATTGSAAEANIALDEAKRITQRWVDGEGKGYSMLKGADDRAIAEARISVLEKAQERARQNLMSERLWGKQGTAQKAVNAGWERYIAARKNFGRTFATDVGETYGGFGGHRIYEARPGSVHSLFKGLGTFEQEHSERFLREYVDATDELTSAIGGRYAAVGEDAAAAEALSEMGKAAKTIRKVLGESNDTIKKANAIRSLKKQFEGGGGLSVSGAALAGTFVGGPVGTIAGAGFGLATKPAHLMRVVSGLEAANIGVGSKIQNSVTSFVKASPKVAAVAKKAPAAAIEKVPGTGAPRRMLTATMRSGFQDRDETKRDAYKRRAGELMAWQSNPDESAEKVSQSLGGLAAATPKLANQIALKANMNAAWLTEKLPAGIINLDTYTPHLADPSVSDRDIEKFAEYWSGANAPLTLLDDLADGTLTREKVEAVKALYPKIFQAIQMSAIQALSELKQPPAYQARLRLDLLLDLGGRAEPSVRPSFLARGIQIEQQRKKALEQQQQQQRQSKAAPNFAAAAETTSGALSAMRA